MGWLGDEVSTTIGVQCFGGAEIAMNGLAKVGLSRIWTVHRGGLGFVQVWTCGEILADQFSRSMANKLAWSAFDHTHRRRFEFVGGYSWQDFGSEIWGLTVW